MRKTANKINFIRTAETLAAVHTHACSFTSVGMIINCPLTCDINLNNQINNNAIIAQKNKKTIYENSSWIVFLCALN